MLWSDLSNSEQCDTDNESKVLPRTGHEGPEGE